MADSGRQWTNPRLLCGLTQGEGRELLVRVVNNLCPTDWLALARVNKQLHRDVKAIWSRGTGRLFALRPRTSWTAQRLASAATALARGEEPTKLVCTSDGELQVQPDQLSEDEILCPEVAATPEGVAWIAGVSQHSACALWVPGMVILPGQRTQQALTACAQLRCLCVLSLACPPSIDLAPLAALPRLDRLMLNAANDGRSSSTATGLPSLSHLETVTLGGVRCSEGLSKAIAHIDSLQYHARSPVCVADFEGADTAHLRSLVWDGPPPLASCLAGRTALTALYLRYIIPQPAQEWWEAALRDLPALQSLHIRTDEPVSLPTSALGGLRALRNLVLECPCVLPIGSYLRTITDLWVSFKVGLSPRVVRRLEGLKSFHMFGQAKTDEERERLACVSKALHPRVYVF
ncbi:hypothetical protein N2152v2_004163 [Parachlorella kessleri]